MRISARAALAGLALLGACGGGPQPPDWQLEAVAALEAYRASYLAGNSRLAERDWSAARAAIGSTGRIELAARAALIRCALGSAALDFDQCAGLEAALADGAAEERAYGAFLAGRWEGLDARALPAQYRALAGASGEEAQNRAARAIEEPLARLVAAGVLFRLARVSPESVAAAVDAASAQGYRRPLLAWLKAQAALAERAGERAALERIRKRIALVEETLPRAK